MIQVYKKNGLFIIEDTIVDIIYPNLTREEAVTLLKKVGREESRVDYAITNDEDMNFEYESLGDDNQQISDIEEQLSVAEKALELAVKDKCEFENKLYSVVFGVSDGKIFCPKKEQWYIEQAQKELKDGEIDR